MVSASVVPFRHNLRSQLSRGFAPTSADVEDAIGEGVLRPPSDRTNVGDRVFEIGWNGAVSQQKWPWNDIDYKYTRKTSNAK